MKIDSLFLHSRHQALVALLIAIGLGAFGAYCVLRVPEGSKLIDIDELGQQTALYQVDLNAADWPELAVLPGIGEKLAQAIVDHRARIGAYGRHEQIMDIHGIGELKFLALKPHLLPLPPMPGSQ